MTKAQYENHFYDVPGAWWGTFLRGGTGQFTVDGTKAGEAIAYITGYGFKIVDAYPSKQDPAGITLRVR